MTPTDVFGSTCVYGGFAIFMLCVATLVLAVPATKRPNPPISDDVPPPPPPQLKK